MPEAVELYGVEFAQSSPFSYWRKYEEADGTLCRVEVWKDCATTPPVWRIDIDGGGLPTRTMMVLTLDRAAMIVALLARPDAQFELVEKESDLLQRTKEMLREASE